MIQKEQYYDYIIASHMIEHCTNFCGFIQDCSRLLKKDGTLRFAVPDKRYCFDHYRSTTSIAEILNNAYAPSGIQSAGCVGEYCINVVRRKGSISWNKPILGVMEHFINRRDKKFDFIHDSGYALECIRKAGEGQYIDIHHYVFTPASFELLIYDLRILNLIDMKIVHTWGTWGNEFIVTLQKTEEKPRWTRNIVSGFCACPVSRTVYSKMEIPFRYFQGAHRTRRPRDKDKGFRRNIRSKHRAVRV